MATSEPVTRASTSAVSDQTAASVAEAAAWLARQGVEVPAATEPARGGNRGGPAGPRRSSRRQSGPGADPRRRPDGAPAEGGGDERDGDADPYEVARSIAVRKLAVQDRTRHELAKAMRTRHVPDEVAEEVLDRLQQIGLIDDAAFAGAWVESRQQRRHLSRPALRRELQAKGVDRDEIDAALESVEFGDELTAARDLARRRHQGLLGRPYLVRYRRLAGVLSRRGFSGAIVAQVLRETLAEGDGAADVLDPDLDRT